MRWHFHTLPLRTLVALTYGIRKGLYCICFCYFLIYTADARQSSHWTGGLGRGTSVFECENGIKYIFELTIGIGTILNEIIMPIMKSFLIVVVVAVSLSNK